MSRLNNELNAGSGRNPRKPYGVCGIKMSGQGARLPLGFCVLVKLFWFCLIVYSDFEIIVFAENTVFAEIEIFGFAEKSQNITFSKQIGFLDFAWRIDLSSPFCFSRADKEITYPDFCESAVCWLWVTWKLEFGRICGNPFYLRKNMTFPK